MSKKNLFSLLIVFLLPFSFSYAAPSLNVTGTSNGVSAMVTTTGGIGNTPVVLYYTSSGGTMQSSVIGTTDTNGYFSGLVNTDNLLISATQPVYIMINGEQSTSLTWPYNRTNSSGNLTFSQTSASISIGQDLIITTYGGQGPYYVSDNSNPSSVSSIVRGDMLSVRGISGGVSVLSVCTYAGKCGTVNVTVNGGQGTSNNNQGTNSSPILSQSSISVMQGQSTAVTISGGATPYTISIGDPGISTVLTGSALTVNGNMVGSNNVTICSTNNNVNTAGCSTLNVVVTAPSGIPNPTNPPSAIGGSSLSFALTLPYAQTFRIMVYGGNGSYYLQSQPSSPVTASITGNALNVYGSNAGSGSVVVCSTGLNGSDCIPITFTFVQPTGQSNMGTGGGYLFSTDLEVGMSGQDVSALQGRLKDEGYYTYTITGYYGPITETAVMAYQKAKNISDIGRTGPLTRSSLNQ